MPDETHEEQTAEETEDLNTTERNTGPLDGLKEQAKEVWGMRGVWMMNQIGENH